MEAVLASAKPDERQLLEMYYRDRHTSAQIAETLGMSESGVRMRIRRLRGRLNARYLAARLGGDDD